MEQSPGGRLAEVKRLLDSMTEEERRQAIVYLRTLLPRHAVEERLMISTEGILHALGRAGDFTVRMIRGIFAEAAFASDVLPTLSPPWRELSIGSGDPPYDFLLTDQDADPDTGVPHRKVRVQVKMQRSEAGKPLLASDTWRSKVKWPSTHYVVEVQKSRKGEKKGESTRPYRFGEFDILAVSLGPSQGRWSAFVYTVERWLLPDPRNRAHLLIYQPVSPTENDSWTTDFARAVAWLRSDVNKRIDGSVPDTSTWRQPSRRKRNK
jgi:hypothetical protein